MTKPSITYGHGFFSDCNSGSGWTETEDGNVGSTTILEKDLFNMYITESGGNKVYYLYYADLDLSPSVYTKIFWRYKTSSDSIKAKIDIQFASGYQTVLAESSSSTYYSVGSATIETTKGNINYVKLYANQATGTVYYDFVLICKGVFTLPNTLFGKRFMPETRNVYIDIPSRSGDITQHLGTKLAKLELSCNLDRGNWKRSGDYVNGQVFEDIWHNAKTEPWQWLTTGMGTTIDEHFYQRQFKATMDEPVFSEDGKEHRLDLTFHEYRRSSATNETSVERFGENV